MGMFRFLFHEGVMPNKRGESPLGARGEAVPSLRGKAKGKAKEKSQAINLSGNQLHGVNFVPSADFFGVEDDA
jgi:hypothetical protein